MFYTYILKSEKDGKMYTGSTNNLRLRFEQHQKGKVESTKHREPLTLIYYEACVDEDDARRREKVLKSYRGKMFIKNRLKSYFTGLTRGAGVWRGNSSGGGNNGTVNGTL